MKSKYEIGTNTKNTFNFVSELFWFSTNELAREPDLQARGGLCSVYAEPNLYCVMKVGISHTNCLFKQKNKIAKTKNQES